MRDPLSRAVQAISQTLFLAALVSALALIVVTSRDDAASPAELSLRQSNPDHVSTCLLCGQPGKYAARPAPRDALAVAWRAPGPRDDRAPAPARGMRRSRPGPSSL